MKNTLKIAVLILASFGFAAFGAPEFDGASCVAQDSVSGTLPGAVFSATKTKTSDTKTPESRPAPSSKPNSRGAKKINQKITALELVRDMKTGWNLGNTLDANAKSGLESETCWGQPEVTPEQIRGIAAAGFNTIRIPVSWANHIMDSKYTIDPAWMKRVRQIVDWAIDENLYVILNDHHDNYEKASPVPYAGGYYPSSLNYNESLRFTRAVWTQISETFNENYDERLVFEVFNEPRLRGHSHEWWYRPSCTECRDGASNLNRLNRIALETIRSSGKNNRNRFVMVTALAASLNSFRADSSWVMPEDSAEGRLIVSVHLYTPHPFAMENPGVRDFSKNLTYELDESFEYLNERFVSRGIPVVIGEYGATNKNNTQDRVQWFRHFLTESRKYGMCSCLWDNGDFNASATFEEKFGFYNRTDQTWYFPEIIQALMESVENNP